MDATVLASPASAAFLWLFGIGMILLNATPAIGAVMSTRRGMRAQDAIAERFAGVERALLERRGGVRP